ncbi:copper homeostasis protein CutC [Streptomyces sp. H10-C2]|uniref:copper homeostasis protein CutC n=1 Tax=unclassified Streptomyces TaxID=2593676 RepID=UPI0024B90948|nr:MULTISPECIES: copper homeostasis protein CutC [unclassified Streptomyces]MDJ0346969.1 copper homeostasis protein CutC [Streptomyces sp. PH10-H1]MDJ0375130.1 copper homeostasis protein CutC [Streptomyces sp. H10-C2]
MSRPIFEVIALGVDDAVAAQTGGADRLELVADMAADGLTPSRETFAAIRAAVHIPLRVMLRLADGFGAGDLDALCAAAEGLRREGADEFVLGFLDGRGAADLEAVYAVADVIDGCRWTFHRAIDRAADRHAARLQLAGLPGLDTYLTAGSAKGVDDGLGVLVAEAARSAASEPGYEPRILVGGGLNREHLPALRGAGIDAFHVGGAVRPAGWASPVDVTATREWRALLDAPVPVG